MWVFCLLSSNYMRVAPPRFDFCFSVQGQETDYQNARKYGVHERK
jgi:hypothetical protein